MTHDEGGDHTGQQTDNCDEGKRDEHIGPLHLDGIGANNHVSRIAAQPQPPEVILAQSQDKADNHSRYRTNEGDEPTLQDKNAGNLAVMGT